MVSLLLTLASGPVVAPPDAAVLGEIQRAARAEQWVSLPIGERTVRVAEFFLGTPYVGGTLDTNPETEVCTVVLDGLDCVTLAEVSFNIARWLKGSPQTPEQLVKLVEETRYRNGRNTGYASRLHYTTEWFYDMGQRQLGTNLAGELPGAVTEFKRINFMTQNADKYPAIAAGGAPMISALKQHENRLSGLRLPYVPLSALGGAETRLRTGDLIGITTDREGLDTSHVGLFVRDEEGKTYFLHASSTQKMVVKQQGFLEAIKRQPRVTGVVVFRPREVGGF